VAVHWVGKEKAAIETVAAIAGLESSAAAGRKTIDQANSAIEEVTRVRRLFENRPPTLLALEEITRILPDDAWAEEFRIDGDFVEISGLARNAGDLLTALEISPLFHETQFVAPLRLEAAKDRERFRLRTRFRVTAQPAPARVEGGQ
jgi:Tfp pilus assembly protein PilN